jgi:hypothetical protein
MTSTADAFVRVESDYKRSIDDAATRAAIQYDRRVAQAEAHRRAARAEARNRAPEAPRLTEAQDRIDLTWRYLREGLDRRAALFRQALDAGWPESAIAEHLGLTVERVEAIAGTRGGGRS